jgi:hypothetical protein
MVRKRQKFTFMMDEGLRADLEAHQQRIEKDTGLKVSLNETMAGLMRLGLATGKRKLKNRTKKTPGSIRLDPNAPILQQVRERT